MDGSQPETLAIEDVTHTPCAIPGSYLTAMTMGVLRKDMTTLVNFISSKIPTAPHVWCCLGLRLFRRTIVVQVVQHFGQRSNTAPVWLVEATVGTAGDEAKFWSVTKLKKNSSVGTVLPSFICLMMFNNV